MNTRNLAGTLLAALSLAAPLHAQRVSADVVVRSGPAAGRVVVGDGYSSYRRRVASRAVPARVIVVERVRARHRRAGNEWRRGGYRTVVVYYHNGRYYDRADRNWPGARREVIYERGGRYYQEIDDRDRDDRHDRNWND